MERFLVTTPPRCGHVWSTEVGVMTVWHVCALDPGHQCDHGCAPVCGATTARKDAA